MLVNPTAVVSLCLTFVVVSVAFDEFKTGLSWSVNFLTFNRQSQGSVNNVCRINVNKFHSPRHAVVDLPGNTREYIKSATGKHQMTSVLIFLNEVCRNSARRLTSISATV
jgi:hypothetical protein